MSTTSQQQIILNKSDFTTDLGFNPGTFHGVGTEKPVLFRWISFVLLSKQPVARLIELYGYDEDS